MGSRHVIGVLALGGLAACAALTGLSDYEIVDPTASSAEGGSGLEGGADTTSSSGSDGASLDGPGPEASSSGAPPDPPAKFVRELCAFRSRCTPNMFAAHYPAGQSGCEARLRELETQAGRTATIAQYDACASVLVAAACTQRETDFPECAFPGSAPDGAPCVAGSRCASRRCKQASSTEVCGVCAPPSGENGDCIDFGDCAFGLYCNGTKCAKTLTEGMSCTAGVGACARGLACVSNKCRKGATIGQACSTTGSAECRSSLICNQGKCEEFSWATVGARCGYQGQAWTSCVRMSCVGNSCKELRAIGETCANDETQPACDSNGICASSGKCVPIDGSSCPK